MEFTVINRISVSGISDLEKVRKFMEVNNIKIEELNISQLAREAGCSRATVRNRLKLKYKGYPKTKPSKVDKVRHLIVEILNDPLVVVNTRSSLYKYLKRSYPDLIDFQENTFRYYINRHFKEQLKNKRNSIYTTRFETQPGFQAQFDFKECMDFINEQGIVETVDIAVLQWGFSREVYRKIIRDKSTSAVIEFLAEAFDYYGGVCHELVVDNAKCMIDSHDVKTGEVVINKQFEEFVKDYGFSLYVCKPYHPQTKGKVEKTMQAIDDLRLYNGKVADKYEYARLIQMITDEFNNEISQATGFAPRFLIETEKKHMLQLPQLNIRSLYCIKFKNQCKVDKTGMIKFDNKYYSVPYNLIGKSVDRVIVLDEIHIYYNKIYVTSHELNDNLVNTHTEHVHVSVSKPSRASSSTVESTSERASDIINRQVSKNFEKLREAY